jgi:predicted nuclease of restriction endonuclease-like (RecB) superfamily
MSDQQIKITGDYKYQTFLNQIRSEIQSSRTRASLAVNSELIYHYWQICQETGQKFEEQGWGTKIIDKLAADLNQKGYSPRNLRYMRAFAQAWPVEEILQQVVAILPLGHNVRLLDGCKDPNEREWYARKALVNGWSRDI